MRLLALYFAVMLAAPEGSPVPMIPETVEEAQACADIGMLVDLVWREARGEPHEGQVAVAEVVLNRARKRFRGKETITDVAIDPWQFSAYNADDPNAVKRPTSAEREQVCAAVVEALRGSNLTRGSNHYLNPVVTRRIRGGSMPSWYDPEKVTARIGRHEFLRL